MAISLCGTSVGNTGVIQCDPAPGIPVQLMIWNGSKAISTITGAAFQTFLETNSKLSKNDPDKIFVFPIIQDVADKTAANKEGSLNQGFTTILQEGKPAYEFKVFAGMNTVPQLRKFNNQSTKILILDDNNQVLGVKSGINFKGSQIKLFTSGLKLATGQNVEEGVVTVSVSYLVASELNDDLAFGTVTGSSNIIGLIDAYTAETISHTTNVYHVGLTIPTAQVGSSINLHDLYPSVLASASMWVAKTGTNYGTTLAITSVADDPTNGGWTVTLDSTAFGVLATGATIKFGPAAPSVLDAAGVQEIEGIPVILTK